MSTNEKIKKDSLSKITLNLIKRAIYLSYDCGTTSSAPLGFSGDTILLHGLDRPNRVSQVSIRMHSGSSELLITDKIGAFLFYGKFDNIMGLDFIASQYLRIFKSVKHKILLDNGKADLFKTVRNHRHLKGFKEMAEIQKKEFKMQEAHRHAEIK